MAISNCLRYIQFQLLDGSFVNYPILGMAWIIFAIPYSMLPLAFTRRCFFQDKLAERQRLHFLCTGLAPFAYLLRHR